MGQQKFFCHSTTPKCFCNSTSKMFYNLTPCQKFDTHPMLKICPRRPNFLSLSPQNSFTTPFPLSFSLKFPPPKFCHHTPKKCHSLQKYFAMLPPKFLSPHPKLFLTPNPQVLCHAIPIIFFATPPPKYLPTYPPKFFSAPLLPPPPPQ